MINSILYSLVFFFLFNVGYIKKPHLISNVTKCGYGFVFLLIICQ